MIYLFMKAAHFGLKAPFVKAAYASLEEAQTQAEHNRATGKQAPLRIEDENGSVLVDYPE